MPRFTPDKDARATTRIFERGEYELEITRATPFAGTNREGRENAGVIYAFQMAGKVKADGKLDSEFAEEDVAPLYAYCHTDGAWRMSKRFLIAASGYSGENAEDEWNEQYDVDDVTVDVEGEEASAGAAWTDVVGNRVRATLDKGEYEGSPRQDFKNFLPLP